MSHVKLQSAVIMTEPGKAQVEHDISIPSPDYGQVLIKVYAVALNPSDWMALDAFSRPGAGMGYDFAGVVVEVGEGVKARTVGDRVAGFVHGCHAANYSIGAFREYLLADADLTIRIPNYLAYAEASTLGMGLSTAAQALYQSLQLPLPLDTTAAPRGTILIYAGSTATGSLAIQLAKLSGFRVITTCSERNIPWIQTLGADEAVDYNHPDAIQIIKSKAQSDGITMILDCIANDSTASFCYQCFTQPQNPTADRLELQYASLMPINNIPETPESLPRLTKIRSQWRMVYTCFGRRFTMVNDAWGISHTWEASADDKNCMVAFYRQMENVLAEGKLRPMSIEVQEGGLGDILEGVSVVRNGGVRGKKLVYLL